MPYNERYRANIADSLTPNFENVMREFIITTMTKIFLDDKTISFNFLFKQSEAITHIEEILKKYIANYYPGFKDEAAKIVQVLKQKNENCNYLPSLIISDYQLFFELLRQYYERNIELWFQRTALSSFMVYEMENCFEQIWLRATPEDFNNPEQFLKKQVQIINDTTFSRYDNEEIIGISSSFNNHILCVKNGIARTWDETPREFEITIYDQKYYHIPDPFYRSSHTLPVVRYGIYEKDGKKICLIGSIQNKQNKKSIEISSIFNRIRYKVNKGVLDYENINGVEPSHLIVLSIFINFLHNEGITEIEVPSLYVLDYQYHQIRNIIMQDEFYDKWTEYKKESSPEKYEEEKKRLDGMLNMEDLISQNKTEGLIKTFMRLTYHYPKSEIKSYAGELDNFFHLRIPLYQFTGDIDNDLLQEMCTLVNNHYNVIKKEKSK